MLNRLYQNKPNLDNHWKLEGDGPINIERNPNLSRDNKETYSVDGKTQKEEGELEVTGFINEKTTIRYLRYSKETR